MLSLQQSRLLPCTAYLRTGVLDMICVQPLGVIHELCTELPLPPFPVRHGGRSYAVFPAVTCSYITHRHRKPLPNFSGFAGCWSRTFTGTPPATRPGMRLTPPNKSNTLHFLRLDSGVLRAFIVAATTAQSVLAFWEWSAVCSDWSAVGLIPRCIGLGPAIRSPNRWRRSCA